jgi:Uma2 family endonuclease
MGFAQKKSDTLYSYADYCTWPESEQWEIINGIAYNMTPSPSLQHQQISRELTIAIGTFLKGKPCKLFTAPFDVRLTRNDKVSDDQISTVVQPDLVVVCDKNKLDSRGCIGSPDLVIEILSRESASRDMKLKLSLYEQNEIKEYWIISPFEQILWVYNLAPETNRYNRPEIFSVGDIVNSSILKDLSIKTDDIFSEE